MQIHSLLDFLSIKSWNDALDAAEIFGGFIVLLTGLIGLRATISTYKQSVRQNKTKWLNSLHEKFYILEHFKKIRDELDWHPENISKAIKSGKSIIESHLVDYLNFFEFIAILEKEGGLNIEEISMMFGYYLDNLLFNPDIVLYLKEQGFEKLIYLLDKMEKAGYFKSSIFVYGTLKSNSKPNSEQEFLLKHSGKMGHGSIPGRIYKVNDEYPGAILLKNSPALIYGEVYSLKHPSKILERLDKYEGCSPENEKPTEFIRVRKAVRLEDGSSNLCWIYVYNWPVKKMKKIPPGK